MAKWSHGSSSSSPFSYLPSSNPSLTFFLPQENPPTIFLLVLLICPSFVTSYGSASLLLNSRKAWSIHAKFGPIVSLWIGFRPAIFIADHSLAHQALIQNGAVFANRPKPVVTNKNFNISSAFYGATWRLLRRNLTSEVLHPSRMKSYSHARSWVLKILLDCFKSPCKSSDPVYVLNHFQYAMFCLLALMCFGDKLDLNR